ncbi:MAG: helix-turn-helix domain-containing protein [Deferribacteraceae bacterium]|nr:helix-turn-helix domain-containing protein [Deferribacteraceae bacterium]
MKDTIKKLRQSVSMTQLEFAQSIGMRTESIQNWENGRSQPTRKTLERISAKFSVSLNWLLTGEGNMRNSGVLADDINTQLLGNIIASISNSLNQRGISMSFDQRLKLIMLVYDEFAKNYEETKNININESVKKSIDIGIDIIAR